MFESLVSAEITTELYAEPELRPESERGQEIREKYVEVKLRGRDKMLSEVKTLETNIAKKRRIIEDLERQIENQRAAIEEKLAKIEEAQSQADEYIEQHRTAEEMYLLYRNAETHISRTFDALMERWEDRLTAVPSTRRDPEYVRDRAAYDEIAGKPLEIYNEIKARHFKKKK